MATPSRVLSALFQVERFVDHRVKTADVDFLLVHAEEKLYSGHRAFVLATFVDSVVAYFGEASIAIDEMDALLSALDSVKTPLADAWGRAGRHHLVYRYDGSDLCPIVSSWFDVLRSGAKVDRQVALIKMFRCNICLHFDDIGFQLRRTDNDVALLGALRTLGV